MELHYEKEKKSSIFRKLESYISIKRRMKSSNNMFRKSRSYHISNTTKANRKRHVAPTGYFSVYVGPEKERFVVKTELVNHSLFKMLLEDAELEYGFTNEGPLHLPCEVNMFCKIVAEMDSGNEDFDEYPNNNCSCSPFNPVRRLGKSGMAKGCSSYGILIPQRSLKINPF
ncbi:hypothetical protein BUALT_Bualt07G0091000 [Buddleja alternifolia]|uniref:Small auxin up regulated protein n=1 Tax=Buddleja alternifolia TaxID=168488 RepID=A0AAV6XGB2_9LAMI|nr:hypothetical protein BUALT_Bualt07G0091000 [Buddleja alternifolia]